MRENQGEQTTFGYLSTVESAEHGFFGGYLLVSLWGRPLEFHCTAPIRPSRAQQILYGPTLRNYLLGEQIGGALLSAAKRPAQIVLTDQIDALCLRSQIDAPFVWLEPAADAVQDDTLARDHPSPAVAPAPHPLANHFSLDTYQFKLAAGFAADRAVALPLLEQLAERVDLAEPFGRIHDAIREAQRLGGRESEAHGQQAA